jgi:hypothetical protein
MAETDFNRDFNEWLAKAAKASGDKIADSSIFASLVTKNFLKSPLCALQLGLAILMDKPILLIVDKDEKISPALVKIARQIERVDFNNQSDLARISKAIGEMSEKIEREKSNG